MMWSQALCYTKRIVKSKLSAVLKFWQSVYRYTIVIAFGSAKDAKREAQCYSLVQTGFEGGFRLVEAKLIKIRTGAMPRDRRRHAIATLRFGTKRVYIPLQSRGDVLTLSH